MWRRTCPVRGKTPPANLVRAVSCRALALELGEGTAAVGDVAVVVSVGGVQAIATSTRIIAPRLCRLTR
jgi:hypothetical protein